VFNGYLAYDGVEVLNALRTKTYAEAAVPQLEIMKVPAALAGAVGHVGYTTPAGDGAPWYRSTVPASARFWGFMPRGFQGADDSTRTVDVTELTNGGGVHSSPRYGSREIRVSAVAVAADGEALAAGLAWLRDVVDGSCGGVGLGCDDRTALLLDSLPASGSAADRFRTFYRVQTISSVKVVEEIPFKNCVGVVVEFILSAGSPWAYTPMYRIGSLAMDTGYSTQTDAAGENCNDADTAYANFINDPYFTAISQPPRPLTITPPNLSAVPSWRRKTLNIPSAKSDQFGRMVPVISIAVGSNDLSRVRVRFYKTAGALTGCGYDGEFYISYVPPNSTLKIDGIRKEISVYTGGKWVPGSHLIYGSAGKPFAWPSLSCHASYTFVVDSAPDNTLLNIDLDIAIRE
jgi:hypothetical protein